MSFRQQLLALSLIASLFSGALAARAADKEDKPDEYDFSWLDPEKKIYVVQNRKYLKEGRLEISLSGALGLGEAYRNRKGLMPRAVFYPSENFGISVLGAFNSNSENDNVAGLIASGSNRIPAVRDTQSFVGASVMWIPFYGKVNLFNQILYLDWFVEAGVGQVKTEIDLNTDITGGSHEPNIETGSFMAWHWGTGQKFFVTRHWSVHLNFLAQYYKAPNGLVSGQLNPKSSAGSPDASYTNYYVSIGAGYTF